MPKKRLIKALDLRKSSGLTSGLSYVIPYSGGGGGISDHGALTGLNDDDHAQYLNNTRGDARYALRTRTITAGNGLTGGGDLTANRTLTVGAGTLISVAATTVGITAGTTYQFIGTGSGTAADWRNVSELAGAGLSATSGIIAVGQGSGLTVSADDVSLTTPGTLTVSSTNTASGSHTHAVTSSSNPGANARLLASDASGYLTLPRFIATDRVRSDIYDTAANSITMAPTGTAVLPTGSIIKDLGDYNRKWRSLYAAELYVETLVAQDVLATIGGRIMVAPTTKLIADVSTVATTIDVEHNNLHSAGPVGAFVYLASAPGGMAQIEVMKVSNANPTAITGGYRYTVTRNLDGSGVNSWVAGDAVVNIGSTVGQGWIDLSSTNTARSHIGPTITTYARTGMAAWTDVKPVTSMGNLRSFVDYGSDQYGFALGNDLALTPTTGFSGMTADRTDGLRLFNMDFRQYVSGALALEIEPTVGVTFYPSGTAQAPSRAVQWMYGANRSGWLVGAGRYGVESTTVSMAAYNNHATSSVSVGRAATNSGAGPAQAVVETGSAYVWLEKITGTNHRIRLIGGSGGAELLLQRNGTTNTAKVTNSDFGVDTLIFNSVVGPEIAAGSVGGNSIGINPAAGVSFGFWANGQLRVPYGTAAIPSISFATENSTGIYRSATNTIGFSTAGTAEMTLSDTLLNVVPAATFGSTVTGTRFFGQTSGTWSTNGFGFAGATDTGMFGSSTYVALGVGGNTVLISRLDAADSFLRLGYNNTNDRSSYLDLHAYGTTATAYDGRMIRNSGLNGLMEFRQRGTGAMRLITEDAANIDFLTSNVQRARITSDGLMAVGNITPASRLHVDGNLRANSSVYAGGEGGGIDGTVGLTNGVQGVSTGTGAVKMNGATGRNSTHWIKFYNGTGSFFVPAWTTVTG